MAKWIPLLCCLLTCIINQLRIYSKNPLGPIITQNRSLQFWCLPKILIIYTSSLLQVVALPSSLSRFFVFIFGPFPGPSVQNVYIYPGTGSCSAQLIDILKCVLFACRLWLKVNCFKQFSCTKAFPDLQTLIIFSWLVAYCSTFTSHSFMNQSGINLEVTHSGSWGIEWLTHVSVKWPITEENRATSMFPGELVTHEALESASFLPGCLQSFQRAGKLSNWTRWWLGSAWKRPCLHLLSSMISHRTSKLCNLATELSSHPTQGPQVLDRKEYDFCLFLLFSS